MRAADFARRRVPVHVIDARRNLVGVCSMWYPVVRHLHRFLLLLLGLLLIMMMTVGTAPDPLVWSAGSLPKRPRVLHAVRDFAFLPGTVGIWDGEFGCLLVSVVSLLRMLGYGLIMCLFLLRCRPFWGTLH